MFPSLMILLLFTPQMIQLNNPIFINIELSRSFISEYPACTRSTNKIIVVPYPSTDDSLYAGKYLELSQMESETEKWLTSADIEIRQQYRVNLTAFSELTKKILFRNSSGQGPASYVTSAHDVREKLIFYHGGMHGECDFIRRALVRVLRVWVHHCRYCCAAAGGNHAR
jgi:hypothetical protein